MARSNGTQTRTFDYTGADLTRVTNPENGIVTYQYDASHRVTKRTDAKLQETRYTYDTYGRLTQVQHWAWQSNFGYGQILAEQGNQRVNYYYDTNPLNGSYSQNAWGRLAAVEFWDETRGGQGTWNYMYSYNQAGRVIGQHATLNSQNFDATYAWTTKGG
jgi:YD repeat-containing protein